VVRSICVGPPEAVVARAISDRLVGQAQRCGGEKKRSRWYIAASGQNVDDDRGGEYTLIQRLLAGGFHCGDPVGRYAAEDRDHLFVAIADAFSLRRIVAMAAGRTQSRKGAPLRSAPGLRARTGT
jgi:hypothetical protein